MKALRATLLLVVGWLSTTSALAQQPVRLTIPDQHPGGPYYSRALIDPNVPVVPVVFYRPPAKVPKDFNLIEFFDAPRAFSVVPLQMQGFGIFKGPGAPIQQTLRGNAVPIWFINAPLWSSAISDSVLTIGELEQIVAHKAVATRFHEMLQPIQGAVVSMINIVAEGKLDDGRLFSLHAVSTVGGQSWRFVSVRVGPDQSGP